MVRSRPSDTIYYYYRDGMMRQGERYVRDRIHSANTSIYRDFVTVSTRNIFLCVLGLSNLFATVPCATLKIR